MSQFYLVAPSGYCINQQAAARGVERLQQAGHEVAHQQVIPRRLQRFAGTEHERLADINQLAQLPGRNRIVLAVRGDRSAVTITGASTVDQDCSSWSRLTLVTATPTVRLPSSKADAR